MPNHVTTDADPWRLRSEIAVLRAIRRVALARCNGTRVDAADMALYDRYWRLGSWHRMHGRVQRAEALIGKAIASWNHSGHENRNPPPTSPPAIVHPLAWFFSEEAAAYPESLVHR